MPEIKEIFGPTHMENYSLDKIKRQDGSKVEDPFARDKEEEVDYARNCSFDYQKAYIERLVTLEASRKIVKETFDFKSVKNGAEFGCGIYGWLYNYLLPCGIDWKQFDINPKVVDHNRKYTKKIFGIEPAIEIGSLYEMPLKDSSVDVIAGLSSWDSIRYFEEAIKEVDRCLEPGGHFVHYQDIAIPDKVFILAEAKKRLDKGMTSDVPIEVYTEKVYVDDIPSLFREDYYFVSIDSIEFGLVRFGEYVTKHLASLFKDNGYKIIVSDEVGTNVLVKEEEIKRLIKNHGYEYTLPGNSFLSAYGKTIAKHDTSITKGYIKQQSFMDVLVVQKLE